MDYASVTGDRRQMKYVRLALHSPHYFLREDGIHGFLVHERIFLHDCSEIHLLRHFAQNIFGRFLDDFFAALA